MPTGRMSPFAFFVANMNSSMPVSRRVLRRLDHPCDPWLIPGHGLPAIIRRRSRSDGGRFDEGGCETSGVRREPVAAWGRGDNVAAFLCTVEEGWPPGYRDCHALGQIMSWGCQTMGIPFFLMVRTVGTNPQPSRLTHGIHFQTHRWPGRQPGPRNYPRPFPRPGPRTPLNRAPSRS